MLAACGGSNTANTNSNANANNQSNLPPGFSTSPVPLSNNSTPGIPPPGSANVAINPNGTPTPGIPANAKPLSKGVTPTPGIPSEAELKKQLKSVPLSDVNSNPTTSNVKVKTVRKKP